MSDQPRHARHIAMEAAVALLGFDGLYQSLGETRPATCDACEQPLPDERLADRYRHAVELAREAETAAGGAREDQDVLHLAELLTDCVRLAQTLGRLSQDLVGEIGERPKLVSASAGKRKLKAAIEERGRHLTMARGYVGQVQGLAIQFVERAIVHVEACRSIIAGAAPPSDVAQEPPPAESRQSLADLLQEIADRGGDGPGADTLRATVARLRGSGS